MNKDTLRMLTQLQSLGISADDALRLRRISMTLHRWHELECGDGNDYGSWCIVRGHREWPPAVQGIESFVSGESAEDATAIAEHNGKHVRRRVFVHNDDEKPFLEHHHYMHGHGKDSTSYTPLPDRERGAKHRLARIMKRYPTLSAYIQTDPRGCALYILRPGDVPEGKEVSCYYSRGIAVYK